MKLSDKIIEVLCIPIVLLMLMALVIRDIFKNGKNHYNYKNDHLIRIASFENNHSNILIITRHTNT